MYGLPDGADPRILQIAERMFQLESMCIEGYILAAVVAWRISMFHYQPFVIRYPNRDVCRVHNNVMFFSLWKGWDVL